MVVQKFFTHLEESQDIAGKIHEICQSIQQNIHAVTLSQMAVVLQCWLTSESPGGLVEAQGTRPHPQGFQFRMLVIGLGICISYKFPGDGYAACLGTTPLYLVKKKLLNHC